LCCNAVVDDEKWNPCIFFDRGISIEILKNILKQYNETRGQECVIELPNGKSRQASNGERLVHLIIKKHCANDKCSYVELLSKTQANLKYLGRCNVFISHAWKYDFRDLVSTIQRFTDSHPNEQFYFFLDYLAVNQFTPLEDLSNLQRMITMCKWFLLVLMPWYKPVPLTRAWCVYEIATALDKGINPSVLMPQEQADLFVQAICGDPTACGKVLLNLDSANAKASVEKDLLTIRKDITSQLGGFKNVDRKVAESLRQWLFSVIFKLDEEWPKEQLKTEKRAIFLQKAGLFFQFQKEKKAAIRMLENSIEAYQWVTKKNSGPILDCKNSLANLYTVIGKLDESIAMLEEVVKVTETNLGTENNLSLIAKSSLASAYDSSGQIEKALKLQEEILTIQKRVFGEDHYSVGLSMNNLACSYESAGRSAESLALIKTLYDIRLKKFGLRHRYTLKTGFNLANQYARHKHYDKSLKLLKEVYNCQAKLYGEGDKETLNSIQTITFIYQELADYKNALLWVKLGYTSALRVYGENNPITRKYDRSAKLFEKKENIKNASVKAKLETKCE